MRLEEINPLLPQGDPLSVVLVVLAAAQILLFVAAAVSILRSARLTGNGRLLWVLVILAFPFLGALAWFVWGRSARLDREVLR